MRRLLIVITMDLEARRPMLAEKSVERLIFGFKTVNI